MQSQCWSNYTTIIGRCPFIIKRNPFLLGRPSFATPHGDRSARLIHPPSIFSDLRPPPEICEPVLDRVLRHCAVSRSSIVTVLFLLLPFIRREKKPVGLEGHARISRRFEGLRRVASNCERIIIRFRELNFGLGKRDVKISKTSILFVNLLNKT